MHNFVGRHIERKRHDEQKSGATTDAPTRRNIRFKGPAAHFAEWLDWLDPAIISAEPLENLHMDC